MPSPKYGRGMSAPNGELLCNGKVDRGIKIVARDLQFALIVERGTLPADPEKGLGLLSLVFTGTSAEELPAIGPDIEAEWLKDPRVEAADVTVGIVDGILTLDPAIVTLKAGPRFALIGPLSDVRVEILSQ